MVGDKTRTRLFRHTGLIIGGIIMLVPVYFAFVASTLSLQEIFTVPMPLLPGKHFLKNYLQSLTVGVRPVPGMEAVGTARMLLNSFIVAAGIVLGKIVVSLMAGYALVYFRFRGKQVAFWLIFITLMLPIEVRLVPTFKLVSDLALMNTYIGLILPLSVSATATFLCKQYFMTIPDEIAEAAMIDGATPMRFFRSVLVPMARTPIAALVVIQFVYGWNEYLWPLLVITKRHLYTVMLGIGRMLIAGDHQADWHIIMATTLISAVPPLIVLLSMQKQFVSGLTESDK